ncbi:hypothetical protein J6590_014886 [Homalodisca vitripennis]|nr:hypothetical protein J6590_014886 [Homalodisca vitripennis]
MCQLFGCCSVCQAALFTSYLLAPSRVIYFRLGTSLPRLSAVSQLVDRRSGPSSVRRPISNSVRQHCSRHTCWHRVVSFISVSELPSLVCRLSVSWWTDGPGRPRSAVPYLTVSGRASWLESGLKSKAVKDTTCVPTRFFLFPETQQDEANRADFVFSNLTRNAMPFSRDLIANQTDEANPADFVFSNLIRNAMPFSRDLIANQTDEANPADFVFSNLTRNAMPFSRDLIANQTDEANPADFVFSNLTRNAMPFSRDLIANQTDEANPAVFVFSNLTRNAMPFSRDLIANQTDAANPAVFAFSNFTRNGMPFSSDLIANHTDEKNRFVLCSQV